MKVVEMMGHTYRTYLKKVKCTQNLVRPLEGREYFEDIELCGRTIFKKFK
jgi:hypothetical protein